MKITFVCARPDLSGGMRVIALYAGALARRGHEVSVVHLDLPRPTVRERARALLRGETPKPPPVSPFFDDLPAKVIQLDHSYPVRNADVPDADVVIATWWQTAEGVAALAPQKGAKAYFMQDYGALGQEIEHIAVTWAMPFTFLTLTEDLKSQIAARNPQAAIHVIGNGVDLKLFAAPGREKPPVPVMGSILGGLPEKGTDTIFAAFARAREIEPDFTATCVSRYMGDAVLPAGLRLIRGPDDAALRDVYAAATVWLFASRREGYGLPILEAMACGTPVVGTRAGAAPDLIAQGENGYLCDVDDVEALAQGLVAVARADAARWRAMSQAARRTAEGQTWEAATDRFEAGLVDAAGRRS